MPEPAPTADGRPPAHPDDTQARVLLRMLHGARRRGDRAEAMRAWELIVVAEIERVRGIVRAFRHDSLPGGRVAQGDVDDVAHDVFERLHQRVDSFKGSSVGELRNFMRTAANFACADHVRWVVRDEQRRAGSLNAGHDDPHAISNRALDAVAALAAAVSEVTALAEEADLAERALVHEALAEVEPGNRAVLAMTEAGIPVPEIQERLGLSRDAVYQRRRRGLMQLRAAVAERVDEELEP